MLHKLCPLFMPGHSVALVSYRFQLSCFVYKLVQHQWWENLLHDQSMNSNQVFEQAVILVQHYQSTSAAVLAAVTPA